MKKRGEYSIKDIVDKDFCINYKDVRAYTFEDGILKTIIKNHKKTIIYLDLQDKIV